MSTFIRIASWVAIMALGVGVASVGLWVLVQAVTEMLKHYEEVEQLRADKRDQALDAWAQTFNEEHARRIVAEQRAKQERQLREQIAKEAAHD